MQPTDQHWYAGLTSVSARISYLRTSKKWADLTINFPGHQKSIKAHKWMLALSSPVFEVMMFGPLAEGDVVNLPDDSPKAFECLLDHLYCDQNHFLNTELAIEVFKLAKKYQIQELCRLCKRYLCNRVNPDNLPLLYSMACLFEDNTLLEACEKILTAKSAEVLQSREVSKLSCSALKHLLENKKLNPSSGLVVFKCIHSWGKAELGRLASDSLNVEEGHEAIESGEALKVSLLPHNIRRCVESLLPLVDFLSLSVDDFVEHVLPTGIFTLEENMSMLQAIKDIPGIVLPSCVRPRTLKSMILVDRTSEQLTNISISSRDNNESFCDIQTSHPIVLLQVEAHFNDICSEVKLLAKSSEKNLVGKATWSQLSCGFEPPVQLEPGRQFMLVCTNNSRVKETGQADSGKEKQSLFGQTDSGKEKQSLFGHLDSEKEKQSLFGQADSGKEKPSLFGQADSGKEKQSLFGQADSGKEKPSLFGQADSGKEKQSPSVEERRKFRFETRIPFAHPIPVYAESDGIRIIGSVRDDVKKLLIRYSTFNK